MPAEGLRSSVDPMTTYIVSTQGGRVLERQAFDYEDLIRDLYNNQHVPVKIWTQAEYDAEIEELKQEIKEELKTA
ncbi:hypothetical protein [Paenibacillus sp. FSL R5-0519]|uniref:hypothetical protein n=1 Tax=Paenibacillus sp. FSL R5-0519 TaxID=2921648 RepID=UPI0030D9C9BD